MLGLWELVARVGSDPADRPTTDPMQKQLGEPLKHARELGYLPNSDISGLVDRTLMTEIQPREVKAGSANFFFESMMDPIRSPGLRTHPGVRGKPSS